MASLPSHTSRGRGRPWSAGVSLVLLLAGAPPSAHAASFAVDRTDDEPAATACTPAPSDCSLRGAILAANALAPAASDLSLPAGTYLLSQAASCSYRVHGNPNLLTSSQLPLCLSAPVTITGDGAATTFIDANLLDRVLFVAADATAEIRGVTIRNGNLTGFSFGVVGGGGGVNNQGTLTLADSIVTHNAAFGAGGGIYNAGQLTVRRTTVSVNSQPPNASGGGGIFNDQQGSLTVADSTVSNNIATTNGGGIANFQGTVAMRSSTVSGNTAGGGGGGIANFSGNFVGSLTITNSTISGNQATSLGGGILNQQSAEVHLHGVTIAHNTAGQDATSGAGGGIVNINGLFTLRNTLIAGNTARAAFGPDCAAFGPPGAALASQGHNLIQNVTACDIVGDATGNRSGVDPQLAPLGDNGGPSWTHALLGGSPALDAANPAGCTDAQGQTLTTDQRGSGRTVDGDGDGTARCDVGAFELASGLAISSIQPREGGNGGSLIAVVHGSGFQSGATVRLVRNGQPDVEGTPASIGEGGQIALTTFDLTGRGLGAWDVVVTNPDATTATRAGAFDVAPLRAPDLWIDIIGRHDARAGRPARYLLLYGNRGNTDAFAVPLLFGAAESLTVTPRFEIAPPPKQYGKIVIPEWGGFYREIIVGEGPPLRQLMLLIPVVPAGFTGALDLLVEVPEAAAGQQVAIRLEQADPLFDRAPKPEAVATLVQGARDKSERLFHYTIPTAIDADLTQYTTTQLDTIVAEGVASLVTSFGSAPKVYSLTQLGYDLAAFGLVWAEVNTPVAVSSLDAPPPGLGMRGFAAGLASRVADFCAAPARAGDLTCVCGEGPRGLSCCGGCSCPRDEQKEPDKPSKPCLLRPDGPDCQRPKTPSECKDIGFVVVSGRDKDDKKLSICTNKPRCLLTNTVGGTSCIKFPLDPVASADPNDKSGPTGAGAAGFIPTDIPLRYAIEFENVEAATAPAAEVVVTDPLDPSLVDLTTLSLGPIAFGDHEIVPPPGLTAFTRDVDLRPDTNLIVRIDAKLDAATALLTWRLTSLDPATMQPPEDPRAGFLPPDRNPPEGSGHVTFTVAAQPGLPTGTQIANRARIVFDANAPIDTPQWLNTIDVTRPTSRVTSVAPAGRCSQDLSVSWSGTDAGSGIGLFTIRASENGGPFTEWQVTPETTGTFHGKWGTSYAFQSVAADRAANVETPPATPSAAVTVPECGPYDLAVTGLKAPARLRLTPTRPAQTKVVTVQVQNRSAQPQTIADATVLGQLVRLAATSRGACPDARVRLHQGKPQKGLPLTLESKQKVKVLFDVVFDCVSDPATGEGHEDFSVLATVDQTALGGTDMYAADDVCPRRVSPPVRLPFPDGSILEKGCGARQPGQTLGGPVLIDLSAF